MNNGAFESILKYKNELLWGIVMLLFSYFIYFNVKNCNRYTHGFATYYTASRLLEEGKNVGLFYDDEFFSNNVNRFIPGVYEIYHFNLPTTSLIMLPLIMFDYSTARLIWTIFNFILLVVATLFLLKKFSMMNFGCL